MKLAVEQIADMVRDHFSYDGSMEAEAVAFLNGMIDKTLTATEFPAFLQGITKIWDYAFFQCASFQPAEIPASVEEIGDCAFTRYSGGNQSVTFKGTPKAISANAFSSSYNTINVPWAEGEVANAPWGATNATINYNYAGE